MSIPETVMIDRCAGCAFSPGTEAARALHTVTMRNLCVMAGIPFECHDGGAGHLCRGFVDAFTEKVRAGDYDRLPSWKRKLAETLLDVLHDGIEAAKRGETFPDDAVQKAVAEVCAVESGVTGLQTSPQSGGDL